MENAHPAYSADNMSEANCHLVAIGGGAGSSQVLLGARPYFPRRTAVIAVTDTGRSTGVARAVGKMPAPGDLRNVLAALATHPDDLSVRLLNHRFDCPDIQPLHGMAFGNLLIAALTEMLGDVAQAVEAISVQVHSTARILPSSTVSTHLCAELTDGCIMENELAVRGLHKAPIKRLFLADEHAPAHPPVLDAIAQADVITIGPGSLFTSVLATLLFDGITDALRQTRARVVFVCNTTTQPGQTDGYCTRDHVYRALEILGAGTLDVVLVNRSRNVPASLLSVYASQGIHLLTPNDEEIENIASLGVYPIVRDFVEVTEGTRRLWNKQDTLRHNPEQIGRLLWEIACDVHTHSQ